MKVLSLKESKEILTGLFTILGRKNQHLISNYLRSKPWRFLIFTLNIPSLPNLWYPQRKDEKYITQIYEKAIQFKTQLDNTNLSFQEIIQKISKFLAKEKQNEIIAVGEWLKDELIGQIFVITPRELKEQAELSCIEGYFFPKDYSWIFCITHENFAFLAGNKDFINRFIQFFPRYKEYLLNYDMLGPHENKL